MHADTVSPFNQKIRLNALRIGGVLILPLLFVLQPQFGPESFAVETMEVLGLALLFTCVLGRLWATLYVGSRKNKHLVTDGPYSMTRNPLYLFSTIGTLGIGLMLGVLTFALALTAIVGTILYLTARREQEFLEGKFGDEYKRYAERVPMFFPNPRLFHTEAYIDVSSKVLKRNLRDALIFLAAIPIIEFSEWVKSYNDSFHIMLY